MSEVRRLWYQVAASLDGFIAGPNGEADWILMDPELDFAALLARFDTLLMGRRTWEASAAMHGGGGGGLFGMRTLIASKSLDASGLAGVAVIADQLEERVRALKSEPGKDIWLFGGGELFSSLLDAGLVDVIEVALIPVLLGGGVPLLAPTTTRHPLTLKKHVVFPKTGTALLTYELARPRTSTSRRRSRAKRRDA